MTALNNQQKQLLFDYCLGLTHEEATAEAEQLISSDNQAAEMHLKLKAALSPLDTLKSEPCPDELAEGTIWRLNNLARSSQLRLEQLLAKEQARSTTGGRFWRNLGEIIATAAVIMLIAGVAVGPLNLARQKSRQQACIAQLMRIGEGMNAYSNDHDGQMPSVATAAGAPWWKVGYQGAENHSNTRHIWLLAKGGYITDLTDFVCPGSSQGCRKLTLTPVEIKKYNDFPSRKFVTYSFRIRCSKSGEKNSGVHKILVADLSPLFEKLPDDYSQSLKLQLNKDLLNLNSINHNRRGQNVLFCDGSAKFVKTRRVGVQEDDIFTLRGTDTYEGVEVPSCETDAFLAP